MALIVDGIVEEKPEGLRLTDTRGCDRGLVVDVHNTAFSLSSGTAAPIPSRDSNRKAVHWTDAR